MRARRVLPVAVGGLLAVALAVGVVLWSRRPEPVSTQTPAGAPAAGSCWKIDLATSQAAHPWPGSSVDCAQPHNVEVFTVAQVDTDLIRQARDSEGDAARLAENLMYGQARLTCSAAARDFLGGDWHAGQVDVLANWIKPDRSGFFACAVVQTADPAATTFLPRTARLSGGLAGGRLGIECVARVAGQLRYAACGSTHDGEFVGTYTVTPPGAPFDEAGVRATADRGCAQLGARHLGLPDGRSRPDVRSAYVGPTSATAWLGSDQTFACYLMVERKMRGSLRGLGARPLPRER